MQIVSAAGRSLTARQELYLELDTRVEIDVILKDMGNKWYPEDEKSKIIPGITDGDHISR